MAASKPRNGGQWTEARFNSFIVSALRKAHGKWNPKHVCIKNARVGYGKYQCVKCKRIVPATIVKVYKSGKKKGKSYRAANILADHIDPVVDPHVGFVSWDVYIMRMFIELCGYQALCDECHTAKSNEEKEIAADRKRKKPLSDMFDK